MRKSGSVFHPRIIQYSPKCGTKLQAEDSDRFLFLALFEMFLQILSDVLGSNSTKKKISCYTFKQFQLGIMDSEQVQINMQQ